MYLEVDNYILVHAGFTFDMPNPFEENHSMLWQRYWYGKVNYGWLQNRIIIHGHTPKPKNEILELYNKLEENQYLNIDGGCCFKGIKEDMGNLFCFEMTEKLLFCQEKV